MLKRWFGILKATGSDFMEDKALRLAAAMAYYAVFSIGPLLVLMIGVAGLALGEEGVRSAVSGQARSLLGEGSASLLESMMHSQNPGGSLLATIIGGIALLFGASGVFGQLQDALNTIWEVQTRPGTGLWGFIRARFLSMTMVLGLGFLLLVSMVLSTMIGAFAGFISNTIAFPEWAMWLVNEGASVAIGTLLFALIFKVLPDVKIQWRDVWVGALGTALLFAVGKMLLGLYLGGGSTTSTYGLGSAFIIILLYIYYSSVILFLGAEFTQVIARQRGVRLEPSEYAIPVTAEQRAQQGVRSGPSTGQTGGYRPEGLVQPAPVASYTPRAAVTQAPETSASDFMKNQVKTQVGVSYPPLDQIQARPWAFIGLAVAAGITAGLFLKATALRKALKIYLFARRVV